VLPIRIAKPGIFYRQIQISRKDSPLSVPVISELIMTIRVMNWESRDKMKMIHLLARYGAKWKPKERREITRHGDPCSK